jgi:hypothetical protein
VLNGKSNKINFIFTLHFSSMTTNKLDAGNSVIKEIFKGKVLNDALFAFPKIDREKKDSVSLLVDSIQRFLSKYSSNYKEFDEQGEQPSWYIDELRNIGLFSLLIDDEFGGFLQELMQEFCKKFLE